MSAVRTQLDTLMKKHERELKKQAEDSRKLKGKLLLLLSLLVLPSAQWIL